MDRKISQGTDHQRLRRLLLAGSAVLAAAPGPAWAQLDEIIVTARKRAENIQNIPVAMTSISEKQLENFDLSSLEKIAATTPQLVVVRGTSGSGANLSLRGIGSNFTSIAIEQSVAVILDGVYYGQGRVINESMFDLERVEILKGPQALFFGKNATAGVISITSRDPGDRVEAMARVGYEFTSVELSVEAVLSGPVTDKLGLRLALHASDQREGYTKNIAPATTYTTLDVATGALTPHATPAPRRNVPAEKDLAGRLTAKFTPSDAFTVTLKGAGDRYRVSNATWNEEMYICPTGSPQSSPGQECRGDRRIHSLYVPADIAATNPIMNRHGGKLYQDYDSYSVTGNAAYELETLSLNWVTGYHQFTNYFLGDYHDVDEPQSVVWGIEKSKYKAVSSEFRAQTAFDFPVNLMAGVYYDDTKMNFFQDVVFPGGLEDSSVTDPSTRYLTLRKLSATKGETVAGFLQGIWDITDAVTLTGGARYTHESKKTFFRQPYVVAPYQGVFVRYNPANPATGFDAGQTFNNVSPEATLTWRPTQDLTLYGAYKEGYKSGGFSGSSLISTSTTYNDLAFRPEKARGWEIGVKSTLLDGTVRLDVDVFDYRYTDLQVDFFDSPQLKYTTYNAGTARTRGVELNGEYAPREVPGLTLRATAVYDVAKFTKFPGGPCYGGQTPAEGCVIGPVPDNPASTRPYQNLKGKPTGQAPKFTASFQADYTMPLGADLLLGLTGNMRYSSSYMTSSIATPFSRQKAFTMVDASARLGAANDSWELALIGKNLTDRYVVLGSYDTSGTGAGTGTPAGVHSDQTGFLGLPRTVKLQLTVRY